MNQTQSRLNMKLNISYPALMAARMTTGETKNRVAAEGHGVRAILRHGPRRGERSDSRRAATASPRGSVTSTGRFLAGPVPQLPRHRLSGRPRRPQVAPPIRVYVAPTTVPPLDNRAEVFATCCSLRGVALKNATPDPSGTRVALASDRVDRCTTTRFIYSLMFIPVKGQRRWTRPGRGARGTVRGSGGIPVSASGDSRGSWASPTPHGRRRVLA
jgi:hypothetical protein